MLWHCWLAYQTCKIVPEMICNLLSEMLNPTMLYLYLEHVYFPRSSAAATGNLVTMAAVINHWSAHLFAAISIFIWVSQLLFRHAFLASYLVTFYRTCHILSQGLQMHEKVSYLYFCAVLLGRQYLLFFAWFENTGFWFFSHTVALSLLLLPAAAQLYCCTWAAPSEFCFLRMSILDL